MEKGATANPNPRSASRPTHPSQPSSSISHFWPCHSQLCRKPKDPRRHAVLRRVRKTARSWSLTSTRTSRKTRPEGVARRRQGKRYEAAETGFGFSWCGERREAKEMGVGGGSCESKAPCVVLSDLYLLDNGLSWPQEWYTGTWDMDHRLECALCRALWADFCIMSNEMNSFRACADFSTLGRLCLVGNIH